MREILEHSVNEKDKVLSIFVTDEPAHGGANHEYDIQYVDSGSRVRTDQVRFQNGPIPEFGANGVTHEALLAIVIDRLRSYQSGPLSCRENAIALTSCEEALMWLQKRTRDRQSRGVEGTNKG